MALRLTHCLHACVHNIMFECVYVTAYAVQCRCDVTNYTEIETSSTANANDMYLSNMNSQQAPHLPPLRASRGTSSVSYMVIKCHVKSGFGRIYITHISMYTCTCIDIHVYVYIYLWRWMHVCDGDQEEPT